MDVITQSHLTNHGLAEEDMTVKILELRLQQKDFELEELRKSCGDKVNRALKQKTRLQEISEEQNRQMKNLESTLGELQITERYHRDPLTELGYKYYTDTYRLDQKANQMRKLADFAHDYPEQPRLLGWDHITRTTVCFAENLNYILPDFLQRHPLVEPRAIEPMLATLIRCIVGEREGGGGREHDILKDWIHRIDPEPLIQSLIMATVKEWVFKSHCSLFPRPEEEALLLTKYQQITKLTSNNRTTP